MRLSLVLGVLSCSVPRAYQSPRTTPAGQISHGLAFEFGQGFFDEADREEEALIGPEGQNPAVYSLRVGLDDRWEAAGSIGSMLLASEVKWNFLRSARVDAAIAPRAQYFEPFTFDGKTRKLVTLSLPVPFALNLTQEVSLIGSPAMAYAAAEREHGVVAAAGLDMQFRATPHLAFQPGVTHYRRLSNGESRWQLGIAFSWGRLPFYGDVPP